MQENLLFKVNFLKLIFELHIFGCPYPFERKQDPDKNPTAGLIYNYKRIDAKNLPVEYRPSFYWTHQSNKYPL